MAFSGLTGLTKYPEHFGIALFVDFCSSSRKWWSWLWLGENYTECLGYIAIAKHFSIMIIVIIIVSMITTTTIPIIVICNRYHGHHHYHSKHTHHHYHHHLHHHLRQISSLVASWSPWSPGNTRTTEGFQYSFRDPGFLFLLASSSDLQVARMSVDLPFVWGLLGLLGQGPRDRNY